MSKAVVTTRLGRMTPYGQTKTFVLKQGNEVLGVVDYWSWSFGSERNAVDLIQQIAEKNGVSQIIWNDN